jgi:hypothetical protein
MERHGTSEEAVGPAVTSRNERPLCTADPAGKLQGCADSTDASLPSQDLVCTIRVIVETAGSA